MKGKKIDSLFVNKYIEDCLSQNIFTAEDIVNSAAKKISDIDQKIKEVENLKKIRPKLLDVISTFNEKNKKTTNNEIDYKLLKLFRISDHNIGSFICNKIKQSPIEMDQLKIKSEDFTNVCFVIKQLIESKVISKRATYLLRGDMFEHYIKHVISKK